MEREEYFTYADLRLKLETSILTGNWKPPSERALSTLVCNLNNFRMYVRAKHGPWKEKSQKQQAVMRALEDLDTHLPWLLEQAEKDELARGSDSPLHKLKFEQGWPTVREMRDMQTLIGNIRRGPFFLFAQMRYGETPEDWPHFADTIAQVFIDAMQSTNPGRAIGFSNGGPVARFVSAVLPGILDESVKPETVSAHLKKSAKVKKVDQPS